MEKFVYYTELYDIYKELFTKKQQEYFEGYYFNNLSFSEMADDFNVSRNAIFKQIHIVTDKLDEYEEKLGLLKKKNKLICISDRITDCDIKKELEELF